MQLTSKIGKNAVLLLTSLCILSVSFHRASSCAIFPFYFV